MLQSETKVIRYEEILSHALTKMRHVKAFEPVYTNIFYLSFHPETVFPLPGGVNLRAYLCGVLVDASAHPLYFLVRTNNPRFRIGNH